VAGKKCAAQTVAEPFWTKIQDRRTARRAAVWACAQGPRDKAAAVCTTMHLPHAPDADLSTRATAAAHTSCSDRPIQACTTAPKVLNITPLEAMPEAPHVWCLLLPLGSRDLWLAVECTLQALDVTSYYGWPDTTHRLQMPHQKPITLHQHEQPQKSPQAQH
jgi:hypothetical protein